RGSTRRRLRRSSVIVLAKATPTGSSVYFFTRDLGRSWRVAAALAAGMVGINEYLESKCMLFAGLSVQ
ncbi:MAG: aldehyde dehydrogenase family protein, partial [Ensifer adhaerens]